MELQLIMDSGAETLNGAMWFDNTSSPSYEQLSPIRPNRCDVVTVSQQVRGTTVTLDPLCKCFFVINEQSKIRIVSPNDGDENF